MKNKFINLLSYSLILTLIISCRNESLINEDYRVKQEIISKQLRFEELNQIPNLLNKVSEVNNKELILNHSNKIYTDSLNGFSVDTDYGLYLEDEFQNKTYTFKIERNPPSEKFENLVLKDIGNGEFDAYISEYDRILLQNQNPTVLDVQNYFHLNYIGKRNTDTFGRYATCTYTITSAFYVSGSNCTGHNHSYGDASCICGQNGSNCSPATNGYYTTTYTTIYYNCEDGSGGGGNGDTPTAPYPNGNGGDGSSTPCNKLKNNINRPVINTNPNSTVKGLLQNLKNNLPVNNPSITGEIGYSLFQNTNGQLEATYQQEEDVSNQINFHLNVGYTATLMHIHTGDGLSVFSLVDIYAIANAYQHNGIDADSMFYVVTNVGTKYAITITDMTVFNSWATQFFVGWDLDLPTNVNPMIKSAEDTYERLVKKTNTIDQNEKGLAQFIYDNGAGIQLMKSTDDNFNTWMALDYDELTDKVTKVNCP